MAMRADKVQTTVTRRTFLVSSTGAGLVMSLGVVLPGCSQEDVASDVMSTGASMNFAPNMWVDIDGNGDVGTSDLLLLLANWGAIGCG